MICFVNSILFLKI